ncbi:hypothetical protein EYF80_065062 [Liparis tanakae]|uniref:Uncharacterized protein n=1 Tax=Liparis tanakae TaxID=230148 RepID=A0A4Z2E923_9TELE|nr:hypothetical protein EYF80_065062 [Liparis tanakae]
MLTNNMAPPLSTDIHSEDSSLGSRYFDHVITHATVLLNDSVFFPQSPPEMDAWESHLWPSVHLELHEAEDGFMTSRDVIPLERGDNKGGTQRTQRTMVEHIEHREQWWNT